MPGAGFTWRFIIMTGIPRARHSHIYKSLWLYRQVYCSRQRWWILTLLFIAFFVQPFHQLYAADTEFDEAATTTVSDQLDTTDEVADEAADTDHTVSTTTTNITDQDKTSESATVPPLEQGSTTTPVVVTGAAEQTGATNTTVAQSVDLEVAATTTSTTSTSDSSDTANSQMAISSTTTAPATSTTTVITGETATPAPTDELETELDIIRDAVTTSDRNRFQFSANQCVSVGDGSYYCSEERVGDTLEQEVVYVAPGTTGHQDIFLRTARDVRNISASDYDDGAPYYDPRSETVLWHSDRGGRFQIISYDLRTQETTMLTNNTHNDMQPTRSGDAAVWQRWYNNAWQIVLWEAGEELLLTDTTQHNIAPHIRGQYVVWNTTDEHGARRIAVYDIETDLISYITDKEGGKVSNPRFVLVYDTTLASGDVITQGFDPETGTVSPLSAVPATPLPDIPSPDPLEETRALPLNKQQSDEVQQVDPDVDDADQPSTASSSSTINVSTSTDVLATTYDTLDLDLSTPTTTTELSEYDLVIVSPTTTTTASTTNTHDIDRE